MAEVIVGQPADLEAMLATRAPVGLYDYEVAGVYHVAPGPSGAHAKAQGQIIGRLIAWASGRALTVLGPTNVGVTAGSEPAYVVPDIVVVRASDVDAVAQRRVVLAVEIRSPGEDRDGKVADYRRVVELTGLELGELWYVDPAAGTVTVYVGAQLTASSESPLAGSQLHDLTG
ncbi:MAG: Uma2 family endonuclease [Acidimicrobiales bacterium]|nr:Uma2 family endonuclease [Acidimicrobiales bacterium]